MAQADGCGVVLIPQQHSLPMESGLAHMFREVGLNLLANFPEIIFNITQPNLLQLQHKLEDPHHVFLLTQEDGLRLDHSWGPQPTRIEWNREHDTVEQAVASFLNVGAANVWAVPHPWVTRCLPLWAGKRGWTQPRKQYKRLMTNRQYEAAAEVLKRSQGKLVTEHGGIPRALESLSWTQIQRMEGVSNYHTQNIIKLKHNRLRLWAGAEQGYRCKAEECKYDGAGSTVHLAWKCGEAAQLWSILVKGWGLGEGRVEAAEQVREQAIPDIFGFRMRTLARWLTEWGSRA